MIHLPRIFSPQKAPARDRAGSSILAIMKKRKESAATLRTHVYFYNQSTFLVTSIMSAPGSLIVERGIPSKLPSDAEDAKLGSAICDHLLEHDPREPPSQRDTKASDWPVFRSSHAKSMRLFIDRSILIAVETVGDTLAIEAGFMRTLHGDIKIRSYCPPRHDELGSAIRRVIKATTALRSAGVV